MSKTVRALTLSVMLPFAAFATTSAIAEDDPSAGKGAAKGALVGGAVGAITGGGAAAGAAVGAADLGHGQYAGFCPRGMRAILAVADRNLWRSDRCQRHGHSRCLPP